MPLTLRIFRCTKKQSREKKPLPITLFSLHPAIVLFDVDKVDILRRRLFDGQCSCHPCDIKVFIHQLGYGQIVINNININTYA